jgi:hypothetical protein
MSRRRNQLRWSYETQVCQRSMFNYYLARANVYSPMSKDVTERADRIVSPRQLDVRSKIEASYRMWVPAAPPDSRKPDPFRRLPFGKPNKNTICLVLSTYMLVRWLDAAVSRSQACQIRHYYHKRESSVSWFRIAYIFGQRRRAHPVSFMRLLNNLFFSISN